MIVDLTATQVDAVTEALERCGLAWATERWSPTWQMRVGTTATYECLMPAIGWQQTLAALLELSVGPLGGNRKDARHAALKARERIAEALNVYGAHPALYGVGMVGLYSDVLPVWQRPDVRAPARLYDILPMGGESFVHLVPRYDGAFTVWDAVSPLPLWEGWDERPPSVLDPTGHMAFIVKGDVTVPESTPAGQEARD